MLDSNVVEIISMINRDTVFRTNIQIERIVDSFFHDNNLEMLSSFFKKVKNDLYTSDLKNEHVLVREIIGYITELYEKKYGEETGGRVFIFLNLL